MTLQISQSRFDSNAGTHTSNILEDIQLGKSNQNSSTRVTFQNDKNYTLDFSAIEGGIYLQVAKYPQLSCVR
jgi:hypothetical protein